MLATTVLDLTDALAVCAAGGLFLGGCIGLLIDGPTGRRILENAALWSTLGAFVGTGVGFALWSATLISEAAR